MASSERALHISTSSVDAGSGELSPGDQPISPSFSVRNANSEVGRLQLKVARLTKEKQELEELNAKLRVNLDTLRAQMQRKDEDSSLEDAVLRLGHEKKKLEEENEALRARLASPGKDLPLKDPLGNLRAASMGPIARTASTGGVPSRLHASEEVERLRLKLARVTKENGELEALNAKLKGDLYQAMRSQDEAGVQAMLEDAVLRLGEEKKRLEQQIEALSSELVEAKQAIALDGIQRACASPPLSPPQRPLRTISLGIPSSPRTPRGTANAELDRLQMRVAKLTLANAELEELNGKLREERAALKRAAAEASEAERGVLEDAVLKLGQEKKEWEKERKGLTREVEALGAQLAQAWEQLGGVAMEPVEVAGEPSSVNNEPSGTLEDEAVNTDISSRDGQGTQVAPATGHAVKATKGSLAQDAATTARPGTSDVSLSHGGGSGGDGASGVGDDDVVTLLRRLQQAEAQVEPLRAEVARLQWELLLPRPLRVTEADASMGSDLAQGGGRDDGGKGDHGYLAAELARMQVLVLRLTGKNAELEDKVKELKGGGGGDASANAGVGRHAHVGGVAGDSDGNRGRGDGALAVALPAPPLQVAAARGVRSDTVDAGSASPPEDLLSPGTRMQLFENRLFALDSLGLEEAGEADGGNKHRGEEAAALHARVEEQHKELVWAQNELMAMKQANLRLVRMLEASTSGSTRGTASVTGGENLAAKGSNDTRATSPRGGTTLFTGASPRGGTSADTREGVISPGRKGSKGAESGQGAPGSVISLVGLAETGRASRVAGKEAEREGAPSPRGAKAAPPGKSSQGLQGLGANAASPKARRASAGSSSVIISTTAERAGWVT
eukprot:jgi/Mesvir1/23726/Mv18670-RA.1